jgi:hypothetical protein
LAELCPYDHGEVVIAPALPQNQHPNFNNMQNNKNFQQQRQFRQRRTGGMMNTNNNLNQMDPIQQQQPQQQRFQRPIMMNQQQQQQSQMMMNMNNRPRNLVNIAIQQDDHQQQSGYAQQRPIKRSCMIIYTYFVEIS